MIPSTIVDPKSGKHARLTENGEQIVAPYAYDDVVFQELAVNDTAYNFYKPIGGHQFVITFIDLVADKQVSSSVSADVVIYEADSPDTTTVSKVLYQTAMVQDQQKEIPVRLLVNKGKFVNGKTTDDDIHANIFGYYIPEL